MPHVKSAGGRTAISPERFAAQSLTSVCAVRAPIRFLIG